MGEFRQSDSRSSDLKSNNLQWAWVVIILMAGACVPK